MTTTHTARPQTHRTQLAPAPHTSPALKPWLQRFDPLAADFQLPAAWASNANALPKNSQATRWLAAVPWAVTATFVSKDPVDGSFLLQNYGPNAQHFAAFTHTGKLIAEGSVDLHGKLSVPMATPPPFVVEEPGLSADPNDWLKVGTLQVFEQLGAFERALQDGKVDPNNAKVYREAIARLRGDLGREGAAYSDVLPPNLMFDKLYGRPDHRYTVQRSLRQHLNELEQRIDRSMSKWAP